MNRPISLGRSLAILVTLLGSLALAGGSVALMAQRQWRWQETATLEVHFTDVAGLEVGDPVRLAGVAAGTVAEVLPPSTAGAPVVVRLRLDAKIRPLLREDAIVTIESDGLIGNKAVGLDPGTGAARPLAPGTILIGTPAVELADLIAEAQLGLRKIDRVASAATTGLDQINAITARLRDGEGSLGRLLASDEAYQQMIATTKAGEKALGELNDNLTALKHTWPLSRHFDGRAYYDKQRVLYRPNAEHAVQIAAESDLFEPGRASLTAAGRAKLDAWAGWIKGNALTTTEVVIAAYTDASLAEDLAEVLTQEQADAVRNELNDRHEIDDLGWFKSRKVAAIGFGVVPPDAAPPPNAAPASNAPPVPTPARRIELHLFTPQS